MIVKDIIALKRMSRPQFIHYVKDVLFVALERSGGTDEFKTIINLVMDEGERIHMSTFRQSLETMYKDWTVDGRQ